MAIDLPFDINTETTYNFRAGFRQYPRIATAASPNTVFGDTTLLSFEFNGASSTLLGFGAIASTIYAYMF